MIISSHDLHEEGHRHEMIEDEGLQSSSAVEHLNGMILS